MTHPIVKRSLSPDPAVRRDLSPQAGARSAITDLGWLPPQAGYVIVVTDPGEVLAEADPGALTGLARSLAHASEQWARPVEVGEWWDRSAVPFHVVLQSAASDVAAATQRWVAAGAVIRSFPTAASGG